MGVVEQPEITKKRKKLRNCATEGTRIYLPFFNPKLKNVSGVAWREKI